MARARHLERAPITEALIDLRVADLAPSQLEDREERLSTFPDSLGAEYATRHELHVARLDLQASAKSGIKERGSSHGLTGYRFTSQDEKNVVQFRLDGFTLSRLKPYKDWRHLRDEAERLWPEYVNLMNPGSIRRVALRYINHFEIPLGHDPEEYLTAGPRVPPSEALSNQSIGGFLSRCLISDSRYDAQIVFTQARDEATRPAEGFARILMDIDVFRVKECAIEEAWPLLEGFRELKNEVFFSSITEKLAERYE